MYMSSYLLPFLDTGIDDICIYLSILTDIPYLDGEKLSMKTFFLVVPFPVALDESSVSRIHNVSQRSRGCIYDISAIKLARI